MGPYITESRVDVTIVKDAINIIFVNVLRSKSASWSESNSLAGPRQLAIPPRQAPC